MSDYTKVFDGAAKDSGNATVLGADHDTEFDAIAIAVNSKADAVASATAGNMAELGSEGNLVDSGIASANLDGLTGVVETRLAAAEASDASLTPSAAVTNHVRSWGMQMIDGSQVIASFDWKAALSVNSFESLGPTGAGATNTYDELDVVPSTATALIFNVIINTSIDGSGNSGIGFYGAVNGVTAVENDGHLKAKMAVDGIAGDDYEWMTQVIIPCDSNQICQISYDIVSGASLSNGVLYYQGFIEDIS